MKEMKPWRTIMILASLLAPFGLLAAIGTYENPIGCTTLPGFIKGILTIVVKIGIPIATIFIIWSGFLFLTAQGDETQLKKAKHAFVWSCIGTAVLLGAWLLATAINATIQSLGGGTSSGAGSTVSGGCGSSGSGGTTANTGTTASGVNNGFVVPTSVAALCEVDKTLVAPAASLLEDPMEQYNLSSTDPALFSKSLGILHDNAIGHTHEESYVFVQFGSGGGGLLHTQRGGGVGVDVPSPNTINTYVIEPLLDQPQSISIMHTHPLAFSGGTTMDMPPSLQDMALAVAYDHSLIFAPLSWYVADSNGVWKYSTPRGSKLHTAIYDSWVLVEQVAALPEVQQASATMDLCTSKAIIENLNTIQFSPEDKAVVDKYISTLQTLQPFIDQDELLDAASQSGDTATMRHVLGQRLALIQSLGGEATRVSYTSPY